MPSNDILDAPVVSADTTINYSPLWRRLVAAVIDASILFILAIIINAADKDLPRAITLSAIPVFGLYYFVYAVKDTGVTAGKAAMSLRVVRQDGTPISWRDAILRYIIVFLITSYAVAPYIFADLFPSAAINPEKWVIIPGKPTTRFFTYPSHFCFSGPSLPSPY